MTTLLPQQTGRETGTCSRMVDKCDGASCYMGGVGREEGGTVVSPVASIYGSGNGAGDSFLLVHTERFCGHLVPQL